MQLCEGAWGRRLSTVEAPRVVQDFYELTLAYLDRAIANNVRHAELFFDPQSHTEPPRKVALETVLGGMTQAMREREGSITSSLIMCVLRHLGPDAALEAVRQVRRPGSCCMGWGELSRKGRMAGELGDRRPSVCFPCSSGKVLDSPACLPSCCD